jgi:hypothetical protein
LALAEIRDNRLYRAEYKTFEEYCKSKWGWKRQRAYELIDAAQTVKALPVECNQKITNENQASQLSKVPEAKRAAVITELVDAGEQITAKSISKAGEKYFYLIHLQTAPAIAKGLHDVVLHYIVTGL